MKKKISLVLSIILAFTFLSFLNPINARAEDKDVAIGAENLNSTPENSGKVGKELTQPEKGWKRYDDTYKNIKYEGSWTTYKNTNSYKSSEQWAKDTDNTNIIKFNFTGSRIRIMAGTNISKGITNATIKIDNSSVGKLLFNYSDSYQVLIFEEKLLSNKEHYVSIEIPKLNNSQFAFFDSIDIDADGTLKPYQEIIQPESITLDKSSISLLTGKTDKLIATVKPDNATNKKVIWSSSDESIAKVDQDGNITAGKVGHATITATVEGTDLKATCEVNVAEDKSRAVLAITMINGITKEYDVSADEISAFEKWFDESNGKGQVRYGFNKKINPYKQVKEYIVFDKIASFEIRSYEADK